MGGTSRCRACSPPPTCRCSSSPPRSLRSSSSRTPPSPPPPPLATSSQSLWRRSRPCTPKALRRLSSTCANLSHPAQTIWRLQTPLQPLEQLLWDQLAETWRCIELCPSHIEALMCTRAYQRRNRTKGFPSLCKPLPILDLLQGRRGLTTLRPTKCRMESRLRTSPMITTGMSPIDMETQEKIKLDRKRQRNRLAASKCRKRKLERISQLDDRVSALKNENADLAAVVKKMKAGVAL